MAVRGDAVETKEPQRFNERFPLLHASQILISSIVCMCVDNMLYAIICTPSVQRITSSYFNARWRMPKRNPSPSRPVETC